MTWHEAMERYGVRQARRAVRHGARRPRRGVRARPSSSAFAGAEAVKGIRVPGEGDLGRSRLDALTDRAKSLGAAGLVWMRVRDGGALESPVAKFLSEAEQLGLVDALGAQPGDLLLLVAGERPMVRSVLGAAAPRSRPPARVRGPAASCGSSTSRCSKAARRRPGAPIADAPPVHDAAPRRPRRVWSRDPLSVRVAGVRPRAQRLGARLGLGAYPPPRHPAAHLLAARHRTRGRAGAVRVPARRVPVRRAAARRLRGRHRPLRRDPRGRGEHPRGHRVPEDAVRRRPADERAHRDRPQPAPRPRPQPADARAKPTPNPDHAPAY